MKKNFPYLINILWSDEDQCYIAEVPELEGCITHGPTPATAAKNAQDAIASWIRAAKRLSHPIPEAVAKRQVSGKFNVRLPRELHKALVIKSVREGTSLNHLISSLLSHSV